MRMEDVELIQMEAAKHEGKWYVQVTYYNEVGDDERLDVAYTSEKPSLKGWTAVMMPLCINDLRMMARYAK